MSGDKKRVIDWDYEPIGDKYDSDDYFEVTLTHGEYRAYIDGGEFVTRAGDYITYLEAEVRRLRKIAKVKIVAQRLMRKQIKRRGQWLVDYLVKETKRLRRKLKTIRFNVKAPSKEAFEKALHWDD